MMINTLYRNAMSNGLPSIRKQVSGSGEVSASYIRDPIAAMKLSFRFVQPLNPFLCTWCTLISAGPAICRCTSVRRSDRPSCRRICDQFTDLFSAFTGPSELLLCVLNIPVECTFLSSVPSACGFLVSAGFRERVFW